MRKCEELWYKALVHTHTHHVSTRQTIPILQALPFQIKFKQTQGKTIKHFENVSPWTLVMVSRS